MNTNYFSMASKCYDHEVNLKISAPHDYIEKGIGGERERESIPI